jgi:hypothetical protein
VLIAGSFREYPFFLLLEIFLRRRETGLLEVSSTEESGYFYIKNGKVKDGQVGKNRGLAAVKLVGKFNDGSFQFKPLAPSDYARVVWQRSFGPTAIANDQPAVSVSALRNTIGQFASPPAAASRVSNVLGSSTQRAFGQVLLYTSIVLQSVQKTAQSLPRRCVAGAVAGFAFWKRAQFGTRLLLLIASIKNTLGHLRSCIAAAYLVSQQALASVARGTLRQFVLYTPVVYHTLKRNGVLLIQRTVAYAILGFAFWKRAQVGTRLLRILKKGLAVPHNKRRRDRQFKPRYPRGIGFRLPPLTIPNRAAITAAVQQGIEHNVIFALIVTLLLGMSGLMLHQLVFGDQHSIGTGTVDEHFVIPENTSPTRSKPKRRGSKRPSADESKDKSGDKRSTDQKQGVTSTQEPDSVSQTPRRNKTIQGGMAPN